MSILDRLLGTPRPIVAPPRAAPPTEQVRGFLLIGSAVADAGGAATVRFNGPPRGQRWSIERISVVANAGTATIYKNAVADGNFLMIAPATPNAGDRERPLPIYQGESLLVVFAGALAGSTCTVRVEGARWQGVSW